MTCPPWCTREHGPRWHDEDIVHYSAPVELGRPGGGTMPVSGTSVVAGAPTPGAQAVLRRRESERTTYVELIIDDERSVVLDVDAFAHAARAAHEWITTVTRDVDR
ncbi:DUF6907 domain-containing protein [Agromyces atrinae]|uniref:DUF6907 domain-containing protein n=1 Tax=Agromyces atrinae TaxID=592376 RepID=UPI00358DB294